MKHCEKLLFGPQGMKCEQFKRRCSWSVSKLKTLDGRRTFGPELSQIILSVDVDSSCSVFMNVKQKCDKIWHVLGSAQPNIQVLSHSPFLQRTKVMHYLNISQQYSGTSTGVTEPGGKLESGSFSVLAPATNQDRAQSGTVTWDQS